MLIKDLFSKEGIFMVENKTTKSWWGKKTTQGNTAEREVCFPR